MERNKVIKNYRVCQNHFSAQHWFPMNKNASNLKKTAVPDQHLPIIIVIDEKSKLNEIETGSTEAIDSPISREENTSIAKCVICQKFIPANESKKYDIASTHMLQVGMTLNEFIIQEVFVHKNEQIKCYNSFCCHSCYMLMLDLEEYLTKAKHIKDLIINISLKAHETLQNMKINDENCNAFHTATSTTPRSECNILTESLHQQTCKVAIKAQEQDNLEPNLSKGKGSFCCEICGYCFTLKNEFQLHLKSHLKVNSIKCSNCDKFFSNSRDLKRHAIIHSGVRPYKCELCDKTFSHRSSIQAHKQVHAGVRKFLCEICDRTFMFNSHLSRHMKIHSELKRFECSVCKAKFSERYNLTAHMKKHKVCSS